MPRLVGPVVAAGTMANTAQPTLTIDAELMVRPWVVADAPVLIDAFNDPAIQQWHGLRLDNIAEAEAWVETAHSLWRDEKSSSWAIASITGDKVVGRAAIHTELGAGVGEIAYWVLPDARGRDVATRITIAITRWAHETLGLHRVELQHSVENAASCNVATKAGFVAEGTHRSKDLHADGWHDMHQHSHLIADGWPDL